MVEDTLEAKVREGARLMLAAALEDEVSAFLGRDRYERSEEFGGNRNGYHRSRELTVGVSAVEVKVLEGVGGACLRYRLRATARR